jgi:alkanesulfonate monooxygenase SsuD/methylene tetrahydromethanopterin reductase-like flavin-dependent oxidoreductase (luciferase family)
VANQKRADELRRSQNPLYNDRKLKLGTFGSNLNGGCAISTIDGTLKADWPSTLAVSQLADEMGFEALVPVGRWRGFGGKTNFNGPGFETYSWAAGIAALTKNACVFSTSHVPTVHPIMAAKQATTIDHISGGRYALNIVTGWHKPEIDMFGAPLLDHDVRYDVAVEWLEIIKRLWTWDDEFDFEGKHFKIQKGYLEPKPLQRPYPVVMNAGGSDKGRHYAAKYCDVAFVVLDTHEFDGAKARVDAYRDLARKEYGREIEVWSYAYVYQGETEKQAKDYFQAVTGAHGDIEAATNLVETMGINALTFPPGVLDQMKIHFMAGWGGYPLIGTPEQIVDGLKTMSRLGLDGTLLSWPRYIDDMKWFQRHVMPLVNQSGLR